MAILGFIFVVFRYLQDLFLIIAAVSILFLLSIVHEAHNHQEPQAIVSAPTIVVEDGLGSYLEAGKTYDSSKDADESVISFLMVSSSDVSQCDIKISSNFDRLKAQSKRTIRILAENRRVMGQKSLAGRVKKERIKRAYSALHARYSRI